MTSYAPDLCIEILRYIPQYIYRFFYLEERTEENKLTDWGTEREVHHPFMHTGWPGPAYVEVSRSQVYADEADVTREKLTIDGYAALELLEVNDDTIFWVTHNYAPIEFHTGLDDRDAEMMRRVTMWLR